MTLSPFEVERREFGRSPFGYRNRDVDSFVEEVHRSLQSLWQERGDVREENERLKERLARFEQIEDQLKNTLLLAQDSAEKAHEQARRESDLIMREAGQKARDIVHGAHEDKQRLELVLRDLHSAEQEARQRLRALAGAILSHLDDTEQLVSDGATTLRAIVQAHPEASELRGHTDPAMPAPPSTVTVQAVAEGAERAGRERDRQTQRDELTRDSGRSLRHTARSEAADAFFDEPPSFDVTETRPREARTATTGEASGD